jgi:hypothetical protein
MRGYERLWEGLEGLFDLFMLLEGLNIESVTF